MLTKLSLFSGILGDDLASEWAGIKTICCVENEPFCQAVIKKHYPDMPIIGDIHDVTKEKVKEVSGYEWVDIIAGGDPCQPRSIAGKRRGREDDRDLWKDMFRVVCQFKPTWVVNENPTGRLTMDFREVLFDLESQGYETRSFVIPACAVNAPHRRDRVFIVAYSSTTRARGISREIADQRRGVSQDRGESIRQENGKISASGINSANQYDDASHTLNEGCFRGSSNRNPNGNRIQESEQKGNISRSAVARCNKVIADSDSRWQQQSQGSITKSGRRTNNGNQQTNPYSNDSSTARQRGHGGEILRDPESERFGVAVANSHAEGLQRLRESGECARELITAQSAWETSWLEVATSLCGMDDGFSNRVARLKALGNAQVPQQVYPIYKAIVEVENMLALEP